jgi:hypothetical protein
MNLGGIDDPVAHRGESKRRLRARVPRFESAHVRLAALGARGPAACMQPSIRRSAFVVRLDRSRDATWAAARHDSLPSASAPKGCGETAVPGFQVELSDQAQPLDGFSGGALAIAWQGRAFVRLARPMGVGG